MISIKELKAQVKSGTICADCLIRDDCLGKYPEVGCPALRFLSRIAEVRE